MNRTSRKTTPDKAAGEFKPAFLALFLTLIAVVGGAALVGMMAGFSIAELAGDTAPQPSEHTPDQSPQTPKGNSVHSRPRANGRKLLGQSSRRPDGNIPVHSPGAGRRLVGVGLCESTPLERMHAPASVHLEWEWRILFRALRFLRADHADIRYDEGMETHREFAARINAVDRRIRAIESALTDENPKSLEWSAAVKLAAARLAPEGPTPRIAFPHFPIPLGSRAFTEEGDAHPNRPVSFGEYALLSPRERQHAIFYGDDPAAVYRRRQRIRSAFDDGCYVCTPYAGDVYSFPYCNRPDIRAAAQLESHALAA